jgi:hypothetical protein
MIAGKMKRETVNTTKKTRDVQKHETMNIHKPFYYYYYFCICLTPTDSRGNGSFHLQ